MPVRPLARYATVAFALVACALCAPGRDRAARGPAAVIGPVLPPTGYLASDVAVVRRTPRSRSPGVATFGRESAAEPIGVLALSGGYVRVRRGAVAGWARATDVLPRSVMIVFDARTGATLATVPVGATQRNIVFSADGTKAVVYGYVTDGPVGAYELRTSDFAPTHSITAKGNGDETIQVIGAFYGGNDRSLYAVVEDEQAPEASRLAIVRVREPDATAEAPAWQGAGSAFTASADGRIGYVVRSSEYGPEARPTSVTIDVIDLRSLSVRNTIVFTGELANAFVAPELSRDGSELYLLGDVSRLRVVDTATGAEVREVKTGWAPDPELFLQNSCFGGRALLLTAGGDPCESAIPEGAWWVTGASRAPAPPVASAIDTGTARYGIGETDVLRLGATPAFRRMSLLPKLLAPPPGQTVWSWTMAASPDGTRIVLFVSFAEAFCPC